MELKGQPSEIRLTLEITRAATGKTETVELVGRVQDNGSDTLGSGTASGD